MELGGTQLAALRLTEALRLRRVEARLLAGQASPECQEVFEQAGIEVQVWPDAQEDMQYACSPGFAEWLRPRLADADLVHGHMFGGWWAACEAAAPGQPVVASEHNALQWPGEPRIGEMRRALRRVDAFFAHGPATARRGPTSCCRRSAGSRHRPSACCSVRAPRRVPSDAWPVSWASRMSCCFRAGRIASAPGWRAPICWSCRRAMNRGRRRR